MKSVQLINISPPLEGQDIHIISLNQAIRKGLLQIVDKVS